MVVLVVSCRSWDLFSSDLLLNTTEGTGEQNSQDIIMNFTLVFSFIIKNRQNHSMDTQRLRMTICRIP